MTALDDPDYWLTLATDDLLCATTGLGMTACQPRHSVGFAAQAVEKALKAAVVATGAKPPRTHDLVFLAHRATAIVRVSPSEHDLRRLSDAHEQARYPETPEDVFGLEEAVELTRVADMIVSESVSALQPV